MFHIGLISYYMSFKTKQIIFLKLSLYDGDNDAISKEALNAVGHLVKKM